MTQIPVITAQNINFAYGKQTVLEEVSFQIYQGEKIAIIGLNGSGKSTLLRLIIGLLPVKTGDLTILGIPAIRSNFKSIQARVGYIFQNVDEQLFMPTVYEDVAFGLQGTMAQDEIDSRVTALLERFRMMHLKDKAPFQLSGGEKRAVAIATVMVMAPEILLMDEPTEGLDARMRKRMVNFFRASKETVVISSHDDRFVRSVCDRVIVLDKGRVIRMDTPEAIYNDDAFLKACELD